jgi:hypothetical protein
VEVRYESEVTATLHLTGAAIASNQVLCTSQGGVLFKPRIQVVLEKVLNPCSVVVRIRGDAHVHDGNFRWESILS